MAGRTLSLRQLNRATLARQMLLERAPVPVPAAIERLAGLQAQQALPPFVGLWTRLHNFRREDLAGSIEARTVVKATLMRATLHLVTTTDYLWLRSTLQPALDAAADSILKRRGAEFDLDAILTAARRYIEQEPRTFAEISAMLSQLEPDVDLGSLRYRVRTRLPLIQVPVASGWSYSGNPKFTLAEQWLGRAVSPAEAGVAALVLRYLAAFGPASVTDLQTWSGLPRLKAAVEALRPGLVSHRDEAGRELFDLPDAPQPEPDTPAPPRFLPEFDNLLLAHDKRTRIIADGHRSHVYLPGLRVAATYLVDGFVAGTWRTESTKGTAALVIEPLAALSAPSRDALAAEGEGLIRFAEPSARAFDIKFVEPD